MPYEFLEDIATADIAFRARGKNLEETFIAASDATMNVMVENLDSIQPVERRKLQLQNEALDMLLFDLLQELIYYKDAKKLMLRIHQIQIKKENGQHVLKAIALGEKLDPKRHRSWLATGFSNTSFCRHERRCDGKRAYASGSVNTVFCDTNYRFRLIYTRT